MYSITRLKTVTAVATLVAATAIFTSAASANPLNPFEALFGPQREPIAAPAYANPQEDATDPRNAYLYLVMGGGKAMRYGIGVGREGFTWSGVKTIERKAEWPDWTPPPEMIHRQPYLPRFVAGGPSNPLGARAMYLSGSVYRIHGTNDPSTIGGHVSSGCIRLVNEDVIDLYNRVHVGAKVVVLPMNLRRASTATDSIN